MKTTLLTATKTVRLTILLIGISSIIDVHASVDREPAPYQLTEMKVVPFNQGTNSFLAEIKSDADFSGWNALELSLFVTVEVSGRAGSYSSKRNVEITAYEGRKLIIKRIGRLGVLDEATGKYYVPVWLYGSFCRPVTIKARIIGQSQSSALRRKIDFQCGE